MLISTEQCDKITFLKKRERVIVLFMGDDIVRLLRDNR